MNFVSIPFAVLFAVVMAARLTIGRRKTERTYLGLLVVAGALFYAWHTPAYILILLVSTSVDYIAARGIACFPPERTDLRRMILALSLTTNLGLLAFFKYAAFAVHTASDIMQIFRAGPATVGLNIVLPIGISFYTFEAMSYTIDVYRGQIAPVREYWRFFLFISFFPHLVAGPIVRAHAFLPQIRRPRRLRRVVLYEGVWLITSGYFLKTVCADNLAVYVNAHWQSGYNRGTNATTALWLAILFAGQIFADFSGYSNIARGLAYLLGFRLPVNFNAPYIATSFSNFWERWHITLSKWLRDYLYIPLGGNRLTQPRTYVNLIVTMLLGGLWHGAAYTFIAWGALHGTALAAERALGLHRRPAEATTFQRLAWPLVVQAVVLVAWVFFRSDNITDAMRFVGNITAFDFGPLAGVPIASAVFLLPVAFLHVVAWLGERAPFRLSLPEVRAAAAAAMFWAIIALHGRGSAFIYFQF